MSWSRLAGLISLGLMILDGGVVSGQDYPSKPIRIVTGAAAGGSDFISRQIAQGISNPIGQPVIVENRVSLIATETVAKAPPDGYTLHVSGPGLWIRPLLTKISYDALRDFSPIALIAREVNIVAVHPSLPVKSIKELISLAKARPGELNYASIGVAGSAQMATELFKAMAGVNIVNIPYKDTGLAIGDLMGGQVHLMITDAGVLAPHIKASKLRAVAVTSADPSALAPGLPTVATSGLPGYEATGITGILAPAKTPGAIINLLNQEILRFLNLPEVKKRFLSGGEEIVGSSPEHYAAAIKSDATKWTKVIKDAGIRVD